MVDRILTINIRKYLVGQPRAKRARKAVKYIRDRVAHYTKIAPENVRLGYNLNALIFKHYSKRMVPVKVRVKMGTDTADVLPFEESAKKEEVKAAPVAAKTEKKPFLGIKKQEPKQETKNAPPQKPEKKQESK